MLLIFKHVRVVTILFASAIFYSVQAQVKPAKIAENVGKQSQKYSLGIRFGPSITQGYFPKSLPDTILNNHGNKPKLGFSVASQVKFPLRNKYSCLIEAGYMRSGRRVTYNDNSWENNFTYNFLTSYLGLRRSFQIKLKDDFYANWFLSVGPNVSYLMNGKGAIKTDNGGRSNFKLIFSNLDSAGWVAQRDGNFNNYYLNKVNRFFFGVDIGMGANAPIAYRQNIYTEIRLTLGQTFVGRKESDADLNTLNFSDPMSTNMKTITFSVIYTFDFDSKQRKQGKSTLDKKRKKRR